MKITGVAIAAFKNLGTKKFRTFLTLIGMIIGISSVIIIISVGAGAQSLILNQISSVGTDLIAILPGASDEEGPPASALGIVITTLKSEDVEAIKDRVEGIEAATGYVRSINTMRYGSEQVDSQSVGVNSDYFSVEGVDLASGNFFTDEDENSLARVAVLGSRVVEDLFGNEDPIGKKIKIKKESFRVIGTVVPRGVEGFTNQDDQVFIPLKTAQKILMGIDHISLARVKVSKGYDIKGVEGQIRDVLWAEHDITKKEEEDFSLRDQQQAIEVFTSVTNALRFFLAAIAAISLIVGGIGIMNIMLVAVKERTNEIGLRKSIGAKPKDILYQFLIETIIISVTGAVIGIVLGILVSLLVAFVAQVLGYDWDFAISLTAIILSTFIAGSIGLGAGLYPSIKASKLDPIVALRYE